MLLKKLFRTAWMYKSQFISMVIMVTIGIGVFVGFNAEWKSIEVDTNSFFEKTAYADYRLYSEKGFSEEDLNAVLSINGVEAADRVLAINVGLKGSKASLSLNVNDSYTVSTMLITDGAAYDPESEGIWLSDRFAAANGISIGDSITVTYSTLQITCEVVGLAKSGEYMICVADENQLMPDYTTFGFGYITPKKLRSAMFGQCYYSQINVLTELSKEEFEALVNDTLDNVVLIVPKEDHTAWSNAAGEADEGKAMGSLLPPLFLLIAVLTMVTTMHRIAANEKTQIGTLKALGFKDRSIMLHYTSYGFMIGLFGCILGTALGYGIAGIIMSKDGMMGTYFDMDRWDISVPAFAWAVLAVTLLLLTLISLLSVKRMLRGTAADALRPYTPRKMRRTLLERTALWQRLSFSGRWNLRDVFRHKSRSAMTLIGVIGCTVLLIGGLGMRDTMASYMDILENKVTNYTTKVTLVDGADASSARELAAALDGDLEANVGITVDGETIALQIYDAPHANIRFVDADNELSSIGDDGAYICIRLSESYNVGDTITFSPYGSSDTYSVKVAGVLRSLVTKNIVMSTGYADSIGIPYTMSNLYTDVPTDDIPSDSIISGTQDKQSLMDTYDNFMVIMNIMVLVLAIAAVLLGIIVLYNLGVMSYVERYRELAALKVIGFKDRHIGRLLISQNLWLTVAGIIIGLPLGYITLYYLCKTMAADYELTVTIGVLTYSVSILVTIGVSLIVGLMISRKNKKIDMVSALKAPE